MRAYDALSVIPMLPGYAHDTLAPPSDSPEGWFVLGVNYTQAKDFAAAEACFRKTLALAPDSQPTLLNLGYVLGEQGRYEESLHCYDRVLAASPECAEARYNRAAHLLRMGNLKDGFADYEARFAAMKGADSRIYPQPRWDGSPLEGRSILVYCEQGLGDALMFSRYVPLLARMGGRVILEVQPPLVSLMSLLEGVSQVVAKSVLPPLTDTHIPLLSLPHLLETRMETLPAHVPYLKAPQEKFAEWQARIGAVSRGYRVGIAWAGKEHPYPNRSCPPEYLLPLLQLPQVGFFSLQVGEKDRFPLPPASSDRVIDLTDNLCDFADTAALIAGLDLVITIDTAVAHLAGAMGKPTWVLLPHLADWRWLLHRDDSPWYSTTRLFRQPQDGDWSSVIGNVTAALQSLLAQWQPTAETAEAIFQESVKRIEQGDPAGAIGALQTLCGNDPDDPAVWYQLGRAYQLAEQPSGAEHCYKRALLLQPQSAAIWLALGELQLKRNAFGDAEPFLRRAHSLAPDSIDILLNLGAAFVGQNKTDEAFDCCRNMLILDPECALALTNMAYLQLRSGNYEAGFANFEARLRVEEFAIDTRDYRQPRWDGASLEGKSILVYGEQGMGDVIQFSRYLPLLAARADKIVFEIDPPLIPLFKDFSGTVQVVPKSSHPPLTDAYIQLLSLPHLFGTTLDTVPADVPYLFPDRTKTRYWQERLMHVENARVGLAWRGSPRNPNDKERSCPVTALASLGGLPNVSFFSLQVGPAAEGIATELRLTDLADELKDWTDTAAAIANLDLVITVDTAVAHLAGALGKPVWVMLPFAGDWRWIRGRNDTPWYPSMRLFWQERWGDWAGVIERVRAALEELVRERHG